MRESCTAAAYAACTHSRWRNHGDPNAPVTPRRTKQTACEVEGCPNPYYGQGLCSLHYQRWFKHGDVNTTLRAPSNSDQVTYIGAHHRAYRLKGPAAEHACVDCGAAAQDWSYTYDCPSERAELRQGRTRKTMAPYCPCPDSRHFEPRCKSCHAKFDMGI